MTIDWASSPRGRRDRRHHDPACRPPCWWSSMAGILPASVACLVDLLSPRQGRVTANACVRCSGMLLGAAAVLAACTAPDDCYWKQGRWRLIPGRADGSVSAHGMGSGCTSGAWAFVAWRGCRHGGWSLTLFVMGAGFVSVVFATPFCGEVGRIAQTDCLSPVACCFRCWADYCGHGHPAKVTGPFLDLFGAWDSVAGAVVIGRCHWFGGLCAVAMAQRAQRSSVASQ